MIQWSIYSIDLDLKFDWAIARNTSTFKRNMIVKVGNQDLSGMGEVAFNVRYGESEELVGQQFEKFKHAIDSKDIYTFDALTPILEDLDLAPSLRFGIESAFLDFLSHLSDKTPQELLGTRPIQSVHTSFSLPLLPVSELLAIIEKEKLTRFLALKIKLGKDDSVERVRQIRSVYKGKIRLDANEAYESAKEVLHLCDQLAPFEIEFIEQPLPAKLWDEQLILKKDSPCLIFADESLTTQEITEDFASGFDGVNIKLMKCGSYFRAMRQLRDARDLGLYTMLGCMIETSLGISKAFFLADKVDFFDLDGHLIIKDDPFHILSEERGRLFFSKLH